MPSQEENHHIEHQYRRNTKRVTVELHSKALFQHAVSRHTCVHWWLSNVCLHNCSRNSREGGVTRLEGGRLCGSWPGHALALQALTLQQPISQNLKLHCWGKHMGEQPLDLLQHDNLLRLHNEYGPHLCTSPHAQPMKLAVQMVRPSMSHTATASCAVSLVDSHAI